jgi:hypothetical protein
MKARMPCQPALHFGMLMSSVVIANQVQLPVGRTGVGLAQLKSQASRGKTRACRIRRR